MGFLGRGFNGRVLLVGTTLQLRVFGPASAGAMWRRMYVSMSAEDATLTQRIAVAAAVGGSNDASLAALEAGLSVIQSSDVLIGRVPAVAHTFLVRGAISLVIPVGLRVRAGAEYMVVGVIGNDADALGEVTIGIETEILRGVASGDSAEFLDVADRSR